MDDLEINKLLKVEAESFRPPHTKENPAPGVIILQEATLHLRFEMCC